MEKSCLQKRPQGYPVKPEFHVFEVEGQKHFFESNTLQTWIVKTSQEMDEIKNKQEEVRRPLFETHPVSNIKAVCFQLTRSCNLACSYCFVRNYYDPKKDVLSLDTVKRFMEQYFALDGASAGFFGGEPTLYMERLEEIREYCKSKFKEMNFHITTNGTLLDRPACGFSSTAEYLSHNNFGGIVSIDGPPEVHDMYRKYTHGEGSALKIISNLRDLKDTSFVKRVTLRGTFTSEIAKSTIPLRDRLQYMNELVYSGIGRHVSLEPVVLSETSCVSGDKELAMMNQDDLLVTLERQYMDATKWFATEVNKGRKPKWHQIMKMLERIYYRMPAFQECGAGKGYCSLDVDGTICACHRTQFTRIGCITSGFDEAERAKWLDSRGYVRKGCNECSIRYVCGSGCKEASLLYNKDIYLPVSVECKLRMIWIKCAFYLMAHCNVADIVKNPRKHKNENRRFMNI